MMVRRYIAKTMPEAVTRIRQDLGKDAVILSSKRIYVKKWRGLWRTPRIEVMAAVGAEGPSSSLNSSGKRDRTVGMEASGPSPSPSLREVRSGEQELSAPNPSIVADVTSLQAEMAELKKMIEQRLTPVDTSFEMAETRSSDQSDGIWRILSRDLCMQGMSQEMAEQLAYGFVEDVSSNSWSREAFVSDVSSRKRAFESYIVERLNQSQKTIPISQDARVVAFVGPTGVGKTTTIAKLAALQVLSGARKVGLLTMDTFRIAAIEQLKTYAGILNVPLEVVHQPSELELCLTRLSDCDLVFIDTAGRNYVASGPVDDINELLKSNLIDETYLVLSMTSKREDLDSIVDSFSSVQIDKYLFTKVDETSTFGPILELLFKHDLPLSYLTTGQNVPDDIEVASLSQLVHRVVFGGSEQ